MKMLSLCKKLFLLCAVTLLLNACKKHQDVDTKEYLVSAVYLNGFNTHNYYYNDSRQLIKSVYRDRIFDHKREYYYNDQQQVKQVIYTYYGLSGSINDYSYNSDGKLALIQVYDKQTNALMNTYEYSYADHSFTETLVLNGVILWVNTLTIDDKGNIVKAVFDDQTIPNDDRVEEWLDYDEHPGVGYPVVANISSKNNPRRHTVQGKSTGNHIGYYKYSYNNAGYVTERKDYTTGNNYISVIKYTLIPK